MPHHSPSLDAINQRVATASSAPSPLRWSCSAEVAALRNQDLGVIDRIIEAGDTSV
jgi:hypothetical protein